jgi:ketosteroid isomerase-like protein
MSQPIDTVNRLVRAVNQRDPDAAVALYEPEAVLVVQPGRLARGPIQLREALAGFAALTPTLESEAQHVIEAGDLALYLGRWTLRGTDPVGQPVIMGGESTDILRRQPDGQWRIAVDNPWGFRVLPPPGGQAA